MAEQPGTDIGARRYAEAVFGLARESGSFDQWADDLTSIAEVLDTPGVSAFLANDRVSAEEKRRLIDRALDISPLAKNLASMLLQRGRLGSIAAIRDAYQERLDRERGVANVQVTTAVEMTPPEREAAVDRLRELTGAREVRITTTIDPDILGGMIVRVGDRMIDGSTRTRLIQLKRSLAGAVR